MTLADEVAAMVNGKPRWMYKGVLRAKLKSHPELCADDLLDELLCIAPEIYRKAGIRITREGRGRVSLYRP